jgi:hypothetical protein
VSGRTPVDPLRATREAQAIRAAASQLRLTTLDIRPVSLARTGIYRVVVLSDQERDGLPAGTSIQAGRVTTVKDSIMPAGEAQRILCDLHERSAPVPAPRHPNVVATAWGEVGFWEWLDEGHVTAREWGATTAAFHRAGLPIHHRARAYEPMRVFSARIQRARELTSHSGHPLFGAHRLVRSFESALENAAEVAQDATVAARKSLIHGDNQPPNLMLASGRPVLNDFERLASGPLAVDLSAVVLGVQHYNYSPNVATDFLDGYGANAPTLENALPYARIRELSGTIIAMIQAGDSPEMEREMLARIPSIGTPGEGEPWTFIGNPGAMDLRVISDAADGNTGQPGLRPNDADLPHQ